MNMNIRRFVFVNFLLMVLVFTGIVVRGWEADFDTLLTEEDAISLCVRGTATGEFPLLMFPSCLDFMLYTAKWHSQVGKLTLLGRRLEESSRAVEESRKGFEMYKDLEFSEEGLK